MKPGMFFLLMFAVLLQACNLPGATPNTPEPTETVATPLATETPPATETPTFVPTETDIPATPTAAVPPEIVLTKNSNCRKGPNNRYVIIDQISQSAVLPVSGRNEGNTWWKVVNATGRECWIFNENARPNMDFSELPVGDAPSLPNTPINFSVGDQVCQPGANSFTVALRWGSGGGETLFRLFRDGKQIIEVKAGKFNFRDDKAPLRKNLLYEIEAVNGDGTSERSAQIVPACK